MHPIGGQSHDDVTDYYVTDSGASDYTVTDIGVTDIDVTDIDVADIRYWCNRSMTVQKVMM